VRVQEEHMQVPRSARYFTLGVPVGEAREIWYVCHGYRQLASRFLRRFRKLVTESRLIVAPEALSRFYLEGDGREHRVGDRIGAAWMTREDRGKEIEDYVRYLDLLRNRVEATRGEGPIRRVVLGFSQGVHTVCRWVALGESTADDLILWGAYVPNDLPAGAVSLLNRSRITVVRGQSDPYVPDDKHAQQVLRMREMGLSFEVVEHSNGHEMDTETLLEISHQGNLGL
jgi:predicted esterase